jgi:glutamyl-Q tRNA(Asp) synthetase
MEDYAQALAHLQDKGLLYRCFKTRKEVLDGMAAAPHGAMETYVGEPLATENEARLLAEGRPFAWRLSLAAARKALGGFGGLTFVEEGEAPGGERGDMLAEPERAGDVVLARKDLGVAYHLAVVVDDARQGITHVIRGADLFEAAHIQRLLQALLELPTPTYRHHRLLSGPDGKRFAKRDKAQTLRELRASGMTAQALRAELGFG